MTPQSIEQTVSEVFQITPEELHHKTKRRAITDPLKVVYFLNRRFGNQKLNQLSKRYQRRHSSIIEQFQFFSDLFHTDPIYRQKCQDVFLKLSVNPKAI